MSTRMNIRYDANFVEQAVFLYARRDRSMEARLHAAVDPCYDVTDQEERDLRFRAAWRSLFAEFGFDRFIPALVRERSLIEREVAECVVREAARMRDIGAELYVKQPGEPDAPVRRTLIIQLTPGCLLDASAASEPLRRDLLHVSDMLDERFAYRPDAIEGHDPRRNLVRDRCCVLWDLYVMGRLMREGRGSRNHIARLVAAFARVFAVTDPARASDLSDWVCHAENLTYRQLLDWASDPEGFLRHAAGSAVCSARPTQPI